MSLSKSATDRVLFNEDYLDMIFPYLSTTDLKSVRLTTPFWTKIATKFLGRKSFKPIRFSDLTREDWVTLKKEIEAFRPEEDPRIKLFQGFHLTWVDVAIMDYCSFMTPFKPSKIIISGRDVSPGSSLTSLLTPILDTLSDLTLEIKWDVLISDLPLLGGIANLQGMRLKRLNLQIWKNDDNLIYRDQCSIFLNDLLANQASTLEELHLNLETNVFNDDYGESLIQFPIFNRLHSLTLTPRLNRDQDPSNNFQIFDFGQKFPNLLRLEFNDIFLCEMSGDFNWELAQNNTFKLTRGHPLKTLKINFTKEHIDVTFDNPIEFFNKLRISFPLVDGFTIQGLLSDGAEIPWVDTLRNLEISGYSFTFNLVHLKKIEILHYTLENGKDIEDVNGLINMLLEHYQELPHLKEFQISGFKITVEQMIQIQEALPPQFWGILTIKESTIN